MSDQVTKNRLSRRDLSLVLGGLLILCTGVVADNLVNEDDSNSALLRESAATKVSRLPPTIGFWKSQEETISDRELKVAGVDEYIRRRYVHSQTGQSVTLTLLCGQSGPISVHPPTACFEGVGYELASGPAVTTVDLKKQSTDSTANDKPICRFNKASFRQSSGHTDQAIRVFWGWSVDGKWQAPEYPRITFRGHPFLYKLYVTDRSSSDRNQPGASESFLSDALPVLSDILGTKLSTQQASVTSESSATR